MRLEEFDFPLPDSAIATAPAEPRDHSRLLVSGEAFEHRHFYDLVEYLHEGDVLVVNDTRVLPARLFGENENGRRFETFLIESEGTMLRWRCLAKPGKKLGEKSRLYFPEGVQAEVTRDGNEFRLAFSGVAENDFLPWLERAGVPPLPPYIKRAATDEDRRRYQTVYARENGSVAAPTAGLHFTPELLAKIEAKGVKIARVTLHVGYGTFAPIRAENIEDHQMHAEFYRIPEETIAAIETAKRVIAVGTTSLRALESWPHHGASASTKIFIYPGYQFRVIDGLVTNFHLPQSSLFILVCALLGTERAKAAYAEAIARGYRFYSYGDAMLCLP